MQPTDPHRCLRVSARFRQIQEQTTARLEKNLSMVQIASRVVQLGTFAR